MKKSIRERESEWKQRPDRTVGVDLGDRFSHYCVLNGDGEVLEEGRVRTSEEAFRRTGKPNRGSVSSWKPGRTRPGSAVCCGVSAIR